MKFKFPVVIIDEDFRSGNASGLGIRALAEAIEQEGIEVAGVTNYGDLSQFAQQQSRASAFILSIDDDEFASDKSMERHSKTFGTSSRRSDSRIRISRFSCTVKLELPATSQTIFCESCMALFTCLKTRRSLSLDISCVKRNRTSMV